ncbi:uncharacterized protein L3040_005650 [Drepanopeziza brunnea f. sp. 'multigermtubi']|uniref:uncharacterized protein n=1 Tax=Drepanopeziza brunnea f. sp. 'multigermtubi' TaxID=698441 RepID=UPI002394FB8D|nr:hypothetical protein L3040_005650 [Drepanopeziza brunnea f. sp. 'multigermtubi']
MSKEHKASQSGSASANAWKKDIELVTCLFRLRCQPPIPYPIIAGLLLKTLPSVIGRIAETERSEDKNPERGMKEWLEMYLEQVYDGSENLQSEGWKSARSWDEAVVKELLILSGLNLNGNEYQVMGEKELALQIKWKSEGDWRAGSTPLEPLRRFNRARGTSSLWQNEYVPAKPMMFLFKSSQETSEYILSSVFVGRLLIIRVQQPQPSH